MFVVIFEVQPLAGQTETYLALARAMKPILESQDGFIDNERFASLSRPGWILSLSTWRDEKAVVRWRSEGRHHSVQATGRAAIFADYRLRVGAVTADSHVPAGFALSCERLDATETAVGMAATITECGPAKDGETGDSRPLPAADAVGRHPIAPDTFESITNPGKTVLVAGWPDPDAAEAFRPAAGIGGLRHRTVRVIRAYGLFDRREAPQYHPPVPGAAAL